MLKPGMVVRDRRGRTILLKGRNACNLAIWWGWLVKDGNRQCLKPNKNTMAMLLAEDVVGICTQDGVFQMIIPGLLG